MARPQIHLAEVEREYGTGDASEALRALLIRGLEEKNRVEREQRAAERGTADKLNPHISDAGKCLRQVTYSLMNAEQSEPLTADSLMNFLVGHAVEEVLAEILTAAGAEFVREERVTIPAGETVITGRKDFDGVRIRWSEKIAEQLGADRIDIPEGTVVELKSTNSRAMGFMLKRGERGRNEHRRQLNLYIYGSGVSEGYLVYVVKDATKGEPIFHAFRVEMDEAQARNDLQALASAHDLAKRETLPEIPSGYAQNSFPCTYCNWRTRCWLDASVAKAAAGGAQ